MHFAHWSRSGITSLIKALAHHRGDSFVLLLGDESFFSYYSGIKNKVSLRLSKLSFFKAAWLLRKFYSEQRPDIVHVHSLTPLLFAYFLCTGSKLVFHVHNEYPYLTDENLKSRIKCWVLNACLSTREISVIAVSRRVQLIFEERFGKESIFVPNGIPDKGSTRASFVDIPLRNRFYSACRIESQKNLKMAIELVEKINERHSLVYHIYGEGPQKADLVKLVHTKKLNDVIVFKGFVDNPQELAKDYDFYLSCSKFEGCSLSIADGLRGGNVVIMTPVGELRNYITDGVDGIFIDFNLNESADKVEGVFDMDNEMLTFIQKNGRGVYERNFTESIFLDRIERVYRRVLN